MSDDLTHRHIVERIARLEVLRENDAAALARIEALLAELKAGSEAARGRIITRLEKLEIAAAVEEGVRQESDKWRNRFYVVLRHVLPPSLAATIAIWIWERMH
jgi:hypothetical protein